MESWKKVNFIFNFALILEVTNFKVPLVEESQNYNDKMI